MRRVVLILSLIFFVHCDCGFAQISGPAATPGRLVAPGVMQVGFIDHRAISESSGLAASRKYDEVFWTHNDKGKKANLYAMTRHGKFLNAFRIEGPALTDWEDIAIDDASHLYLGDIGNNEAKRTQLAVHQLDEPNPKSASVPLIPRLSWQLRFPNKPFDCESLFVWQSYGYVISKVFKDRQAEIFRFPLTEQKEPLVLEWVARLPLDSPVTGADLSADGRLLGLVCKSGAYVFDINGDVAKAGQAKFHHTKFRHEHIEGCCFVPEGLLATAESREIYLFTDKAFHPAR